MSAPEPGFVRFVESRSTALLRTATLLCHGNDRAAEDLLQASVIKAYLSWRRIGPPDGAEPYVRTVLVRSAVKRDRSQPVSPEPASASRAQPPATTGDPIDLAERLHLWPFLAGLSGRARAVLVLRCYEDLSEAQIAHVLGCSREAVRTDKSDGLDRLHDALCRPVDPLMAPPDRLEALLTVRMHAEVDDLRASSALLREVPEAAMAAKRRRVAAHGGAAVAAAVVLGTAIAATTGSPEPIQLTEPTDTPSSAAPIGSVQPARPYAWAGTLPRDLAPQVPFIAAGVLHAPGVEYRFRSGSGGSVVGNVRIGWLVRLEDAGSDMARYVLVSSAGPAPALPRADNSVFGAAVSPDGQSVVYGGQVVDVVTGRRLETMPDDARVILGWISPGVVYVDKRRNAWLWPPEGTPTRLGVQPGAVPGEGDTVLDSADPCGRVVEVSREAVLTTLYQACDEDDPVALSPHGAVVLTIGGEAVNLLSGDRTALPIPLIEAASRGQVAWEDEQTVVFPVYRMRGGSPDRVRFVRCATWTGKCSLAGGSFPTDNGDELKR